MKFKYIVIITFIFGIIIFFITLAVSSCNKDVETKLITEVDGCKVYRITNGCNGPIYTTICNNKQTTQWTEPQGKSVILRQSDTNYKK